jgi:hypothetical protein
MKYLSILISIIIVTLPLLIVGKIALIGIFSFYLIAWGIIFMLWMLISSKKVGISFVITLIFFLLFFYIAPILQLSKDNNFLVNTIRVDIFQIFIVNGMTFIFLLFYNLFYFLNGRHKIKTFIYVRKDSIPTIYFALVFCSFLISGWAISEINLSMLININMPEDEDLIMNLFKQKIIFLIPFLTLSIYLSDNLKNRSFIIVAILLLMVFLTKNPIFDRRNSLGPIYLTLICIAYPFLVSSSKNFFIFIFGILVIAFPSSSVFTHYDPSNWWEVLSSNLIFEEITGHFTDIHYDAWANFVGAVDYVEKKNFHYGLQTIGSLLFFVPRSFWAEKPISSGQLLGEYLSRNYQLWFENISFPFPAEGYIDFGLPGVILFAIALAWYSRRIDVLANINDNAIIKISSIYFSIFLLFILRGSLLPATAYGIGAYLAITVVPFIFSKLWPRQFNFKKIRLFVKSRSPNNL